MEDANIDKKLPPIFERPCITPIKIYTTFLNLIIKFDKDKSLSLFKVISDDIIKTIEIQYLKSMFFSKLRTRYKNIPKKGMQ